MASQLENSVKARFGVKVLEDSDRTRCLHRTHLSADDLKLEKARQWRLNSVTGPIQKELGVEW